jgi:hypothetical protein
MRTCDFCGSPFDPNGYHVVAGGRLYDSYECAVRDGRPQRSAVMSAYVAAVRRRIDLKDVPPVDEQKPVDLRVPDAEARRTL